MTEDGFHLVQFNISRLSAALDDPSMREFVEFLDPVNAFAEGSAGFVWRLTAADGAAASYLPPPYPDPMVITNLTAWEDLASLRRFTYESVHRYFLQSRRKWFDRAPGRQVVLWWAPRGHLPTLDEAKAKLGLLEASGTTPHAFTFQDAYDPLGRPAPRPGAPERQTPAEPSAADTKAGRPLANSGHAPA